MQKTKIFLGFGTHMITDIYPSFIIGMIPILAVKLELSLFLIGILTSVNFISASLSQPVFGFLSDKYGIRHLLILGPLIASVFISLLGIAPAYWVIIICLFLGNLGVAAIHPPTAAIANLFGGRRKGLANSIISFGGALGFSFGSVFIIFIIERFGMMFTPLAAIPGIVTAAILMKFAPNITVSNSKDHIAGFLNRLKKVKKPKITLLITVIFISYCREVMNITLLTFMPLYFTARGIRLIDFGYIFMAFIIIGGIGGLIAGYYSDRIHKRFLVIQILLFMSIPAVFAIFMVPVNTGIIFFILAGLFSISTLPLCTRMSQDIFPGNVSLASSFSMGAAAGGAAITFILIGRIADIVGMITIIRYATIFPLAACLLLFFFPFIKATSDMAGIKE